MIYNRSVETTASLSRDDPEDYEDKNIKFVLNQIADKDLEFNYDGEVVFEASDDGESLAMSTTIKTSDGNVSGTFYFSRYDLDSLNDKGGVTSRRASFCHAKNASRRNSIESPNNRSRRNSVNLLPGGIDPSQFLSSIQNKFGANLSVPMISEKLDTALNPEIEISHH